MPSLEYLKWDSDFFGKKIGRCEFYTPDDVVIAANVLAEAQSKQYELLYLFTPENQPLPKSVSNQLKANLIDIRVTYTYQIDQPFSNDNPNIYTVHPAEDRSQFYNLAYQCGEYSRFKVDPHFSEEAFQQLYRSWVDKSIDSVIADKVFVYMCEGKAVGMITVKISGGIGQPGLVATDYTQRGKGVGKAYFHHMLAYLYANNVAQMNVSTQQANQTACLFYEKLNCQLVSKTNIYHVWL
ncbi:GNAT family N-acetyltransferase [Spirosoma sp. BT702]|uniref:GNAT family N-acetyltransferase n=1 Tax=Spirosoma profusum TaxID=2771354 RepID=A0A926Y2D2_9BACT|nr:GNAT family N-acetyltransferase [Spirosoma profusum]MBD2700686.1 GNAT family N-acetyltransferase [Spirosoma profusum]